jgi:putative glycosyltransferase (TIGR04372 family)
MCACADQFLRRLQLGIIPSNGLYVGFVTSMPTNKQLFHMYVKEMRKRGIIILTSPLIRQLNVTFLNYAVSSFIIRRSGFYVKAEWQSNELHIFDRTKPVLKFTPSEEQQGKVLLKNMGLDKGDWYICFHSRDPNYLFSIDPPYAMLGWDRYRDCDVENYMPAAEYIVSRGGYAVRVGHVVAKKLPNPTNPKIVDYSLRYRTNFGDVYLPGKCKFFLANTTGLFLVSTVFSVPVALANFVPLEYIFWMRKGDLFIPKKIKSVRLGRLLTFRETLEAGAGRFLRSYQFQQAGLEVIENSGEEILALTEEMNRRIDGTWQVENSDEELQNRFRAIFKPEHLCYGFSYRIGTVFLRNNKFLIME